jgi:Arm DNA-binding domain
MTTVEAKKKVISIRGPRMPRMTTDEGPQIDFADAVKVGRFEEYVKDMQSGRFPLQRLHLSDTEGNGLRVIIRKTGLITYHCHYFAPPDPPQSLELDEEEAVGGRPLQKIGSYPSTSVATARHRAQVITTLAKNGIDFRWGLLPRVLREIDEKGVRWKP